MKISDVSIDRPVFTTMAALAVLVMGGLAVTRLGVDLFPDVSFPVVAITTVYPGSGPTEVEQQVTKRIEDAVSTINGVEMVRSYSRDSVSVVVVMFKLSANQNEANSDVRDRLQAIRPTLPDGVKEPLVQKFDPSAAPILTYAVKGKGSPVELTRMVEDKVRPVLESIDGVGSVAIRGGVEREIQIDLEQDKVQALGLSVTTVAQLLRAEAIDLPGGRLTVGGREFSIKAAGRFSSPRDVEDVVLTSRPDGTQIRVRDVATVVDGTAEVRTIARFNGEPAVLLDVMKQSGANTVAVSEAVIARVDTLLEEFRQAQPSMGGSAAAGAGAAVEAHLDAAAKAQPGAVEMKVVNQQAKFIKKNIERLRSHLVIGGVLAILVIFVFMLDVRSTLISAVALPSSVIGTFFVIWQLGFSFNIMTMLALTLAIGLLIDDSVVVRENIFRHLEMGQNPMEAARKGTSEIALAVLATTLTICAVFVPIAFMEGMVGLMFKQFGLTLTAAVLMSLLVSFTLDPMMSARIAQHVDPHRHEKMRTHWFYGPPTRLFAWMDEEYRAILKVSLRWRKATIAGAALLFVGSIALIPFMGAEFVNPGDQGKFNVQFEAPAGIALADTDALARTAEAALRKVPEVTDVITTVGVDRDASIFITTIITTPKISRTTTIDEIMDGARHAIAGLPGVTTKLAIPGIIEGGGIQQPQPVQLLLMGPDLAELNRVGTKVFGLVRNVPGTSDVGIDTRPGSPEQRFVVNRTRAADRGVMFASAAQALRFAVEGDVVGTMPDQGDDVEVRVRLREEDRNTIARLRAIVVPSRTGQLVRLDELVDVIEADAPASITHNARQRAITVTSNLRGRSLGEVIADTEAALAKNPLPPGYSYKFEGQAKDMKDTFSAMVMAIALGIIFIYLILASQFESFVHPFTIMLALPLAIIGALAALFLVNVPIGMPAMIGIILLMGLVTKNGILLVDYTNQVRHRTGKAPVDALLEAAPVRLRPILMTSAAIVLGELPTALSTAEGSEFNVPMAVAVIGGVITSTFLTLLVVPVAYTWIDKLSIKKYHQSEQAPPATPASFSTPAE
ncbi:MAG: efflux RND transporter permease subunit [Deltaproteobacteria bacterium]|nr:efflux RND transporter permease subunit [Deltaproteobacteria bacterium]